MDSKPAHNTTTQAEALRAALGERLEFNKPMAPLTTFKTGGPADFFFAATNRDEVVAAVRVAQQYSVEFFVIGGGSNLLVSDQGYRGLIIQVAVTGLRVEQETEVVSGAGEQLMALVAFTADNSLAGMEFAAGIGGTVGGAVYGNAGAYGGDMSQVLSQAVLVDGGGQVKTEGRDYLRFGYRDSYLKSSHEILVEARFQLARGERREIRDRINGIMSERNRKFPPSDMCAGCFFKNIPDPSQEHGKLPAGRLLEQVGAKQMSVGDARVSPRHANVLVNTGRASSKDIRQLADKLKEKVFLQLGIKLQEEVIQIGEF